MSRYLSKVATDVSIRISVVTVAILFWIFVMGFMAGLGFVTVVLFGSN